MKKPIERIVLRGKGKKIEGKKENTLKKKMMTGGNEMKGSLKMMWNFIFFRKECVYFLLHMFSAGGWNGCRSM